VAAAAAAAAEAEAAYNLGRAAHEIGLLHVAVAHYERVLQLADEAALAEAQQQLQAIEIQPPPPPQQQQQQQQHKDEVTLEHQQLQDAQQKQQQRGEQQQQKLRALKPVQLLSRQLAREAAHNLSLIYRGSGADDLARHILRTYVTI
jgi:hypothetical protein